MYAPTTATRKIAGLRKRIRAVQGGTAASKTISVLLCLIDMAQQDTRPTLTSVVSESLPHLKKGAIRDFQSILQAHNYWDDAAWSRTDFTYTFPTGSKIEFFGVDSPDKVRGPRRDRLFVNECNNVGYEAYDQLEVRTREVVFLDWNPTNEFWFYTDLLPSRKKDIDYVTLTYRDNEALEPAVVESIESRQGNLTWWTVYGLGQLGAAEGRIYKDWKVIDEIPHEARLERWGLDFGYTNDPTAIVGVYYWNGGYVLHEACYQKGMSNRAIYGQFENLDLALVKADSAEPKSIDDLRLMGLNVLSATKGAGSVARGIQLVQDARIFVTKDSVNLLKEYRSYMWDENAGDKRTPLGGLDHALDALRYAFDSLQGMRKSEPLVFSGGDPVTGYGSHAAAPRAFGKGYRRPDSSSYRSFGR